MALAVSMFTHVLNEIGIEGDTHARHLVILIHALVAEAVLEETRTDAMLLILVVHLTVKHLSVLLYPDEIFVHVMFTFQFRVVLSD